MKKIIDKLLCATYAALLLCSHADAQTTSALAAQELLDLAGARKVVTAEVKIDSPIFSSMQSERISLWEKRASLLMKRNGLSAVEYVANSGINIEIDLLSAKINELDKKKDQHFVSAKNSGIDQPYIDKCLARILKQASDELKPFANGNFSGKTVLSFYILPTGDIRKLKVSSSTGQGLLDDTLIDAVVRSSPCDIFSEAMKDRLDFLHLTVPFEFGAKRASPLN